jgi:prepilin-type processing-associated H-X9-DG protein
MVARIRGGLALVEVLVVIAIIGVLVALIFPAIQAARGSSRTTACKNNLKQLCLAVLQHASSNAGRLPASWRDIHDKYGKPAATANYDLHQYSFSWRASILPRIEEQSIYDQLNFKSTPISADNVNLTQTILKIFQCPSTPDSPRMALPSHGSVALGANDYSHVFVVRDGEPLPGETGYGGNYAAGAWYALPRYDSSTLNGGEIVSARGDASLRYTTDGLSKTILLAEKAGFPNLYINGNATQNSPWGEGVWAAGELGGFGKARVNYANFPSIYSFHSGGANAGLCDGSVRFLSEDTGLEIVVALLTRDSGDQE